MPPNAPEIRADRFALAPFADESVLVDLHRGAFYRINHAARIIFERLAEGAAPEAVVEYLTRAYSIDESEAQRDVAAVIAQVLAEKETRLVNPISFTALGGRHCMSWQGRPLCWLDHGAARLTLCPGIASKFESQLQQILLWAAPHWLALASQEVLHAAAVRTEIGVVAFCGASGAGKTTLAGLLAEQGHALVSEDLTLIVWDQGAPHALLEAEATIRAWAAEQSSILAAQGWIQTDGIQRAADGGRAPLRSVYFLKGERSSGTDIASKSLAPAQALVKLLQNGFAELGQPEIWQRLARASERLVRSVEMFSLTCPEGVDVLRREVNTYSWMTKS